MAAAPAPPDFGEGIGTFVTFDTGGTDFHLPGGQYDTVGHTETGRAFGSWVSDYCHMMCHPAGPTGFNRGVGDFQSSYGWLSKGKWPAATLDVSAGFSQYQSFTKWF